MPVWIKLCHVGQAAPDNIEAVPHTGLAEQQALAVWAILHPQEGSTALLGEVHMVRGIDDFNAQIKGLQKCAAGQQGPSHLPHDSFGNIAKWTNILAGHSDTF